MRALYHMDELIEMILFFFFKKKKRKENRGVFILVNHMMNSTESTKLNFFLPVNKRGRNKLQEIIPQLRGLFCLTSHMLNRGSKSFPCDKKRVQTLQMVHHRFTWGHNLCGLDLSPRDAPSLSDYI